MNITDNKNYSSIAVLKRLLLMGKKYIPWFTVLCIAAVIRSFVGILDTESFRRMINGASQADFNLLRGGIILGLVALTGGLILDFVIDYYGEVLNFISTRELQSKIIRKLTKVQMIKYEAFHSGDIIDRLDNCATSAQNGLNTNTRTILESTLVIVFSLTYLTYLNFQLMISTLLFMVILPVVVNPLSKVLRTLYDNRQKLRVEKDSFVQDCFQGAEVVRSFSLSGRLSQIYKDRFDSLLKLIKKILVLEGFVFNIHFMVIFGGDLFILGFGAWLVYKGKMDVGSVLSFLIMFERIMQPISKLASIWPQFQSSISSGQKVFELMDLPEEQWKRSENCLDNYSLHGDAELNIDKICFGYSQDSEVLKGISFICERGKVTALVGPSGSGKSTLLKMLIRLYEPGSGDIRCNSMSIKWVLPEDWRREMAYVSQDPLLFSGTVKENIAYGNEKCSDADIIKAASEANIHEVIMSIPEGYNSKIGEQGIRLSGGERQRISIARAMLRNPKILILDEPTSALDSENERLIQEALNKLMIGRTTIIVAHRLSTIQNAHKIAFIEDGIVKEQGNHEELMALRGKYYEMHDKMKRTTELGLVADDIKEVAAI